MPMCFITPGVVVQVPNGSRVTFNLFYIFTVTSIPMLNPTVTISKSPSDFFLQKIDTFPLDASCLTF